MNPSQHFIDFIVTQIKGAGEIRYKRMFGGCCLYCDHKVVALMSEGEVFIKTTPAGREFLGDKAVEKSPYPSARPHFVLSGASLEDALWLKHLIRITANALPAPRKK